MNVNKYINWKELFLACCDEATGDAQFLDKNYKKVACSFIPVIDELKFFVGEKVKGDCKGCEFYGQRITFSFEYKGLDYSVAYTKVTEDFECCVIEDY